MPRARNTDPWTSHAAAMSIAPEKMRASQAHVWECLRRIGPSTDEEWMGYYKRSQSLNPVIPMQSDSGLRSRRGELVKDHKLVVDTGESRKLKSGRQAKVWRAVENAKQ